MSQTIEEYLSQLRSRLAGRDPAIIRDALADTEEHLRCAMDGQPPEALASILEDFGNPEETAAAYAIIEEHLPSGFPTRKPSTDKPWYARFFNVLVDPHSWGSVLYMLISLITGTLYFSWVVTGLSLSISCIILIFGIPLAILTLISFRGLALLEGRIVEALLGIRMPRRPVFTRKDLPIIQRVKEILSSRVTWFSLIYLVIQFPLGILYFCLIIILFAVSLSLFAQPVFQYLLGQSVYYWNGYAFFFPVWSMPFIVLAGILLFVVTMHLAKGIGLLHGKMARALLVVE